MHHNINMFTTGNNHLKYRRHRVHSEAHKLKIRSSRLVLTTGTDLDSTDRAAIGGAKNSSASELLKRPILSLWNSPCAKQNSTGRVKTKWYWSCKNKTVLFGENKTSTGRAKQNGTGFGKAPKY